MINVAWIQTRTSPFGYYATDTRTGEVLSDRYYDTDRAAYYAAVDRLASR